MIYNFNLFKMSFKMKLATSLSILIRVIAVVPITIWLAYFLNRLVIFDFMTIIEVLGIGLILLGLATILEKYRFGLVNLASGVLVLLIGFNFLAPVVQGLSTQERLEDFDFLHKIISENFPFLTANERAFGVNWLDREDVFRSNIENNTRKGSPIIANSMFASEISRITQELFNSLTGPITRNFFWGHTVLTNPQYNNNFTLWSEVLNDENVLKWYDFELAEDQAPPNPFENIGRETILPDSFMRNIRMFRRGTIIPGEVAYLRIFSMNELRSEEDGRLIRDFLKEIKDYDKLLIDIRDNPGGTDRYWMENIIAPLIKEEVSVDTYFFVRGDYTSKFFRSRDIPLNPISDLNPGVLGSFPEGLKKDFQYYGIHTVRIEPKDPIGFRGDIYLLTNRASRGAAERFANFVRGSNFATLVGDYTGFNAPIFEPILFSLPNSGMVIRYRGELAINADGNISSHVGIAPDYRIKNSGIKFPAIQADEVISFILNNR